MENQNNNQEIPQDDSWLDDILGEQVLNQELGPDEQAIADAGLIRPEELELESIIQETLGQEEAEQEIPGQELYATQMYTSMQFPESEDDISESEEEIYPADETAPPQKPAKEEIKGEEAPLPKRRPKMKKGYGLFGIPHLLVTCVWLAIVLAIGVYLGRMVWLCAEDVLALGKTPDKVTVTIDEEDDIAAIAEKLKNAGMIRYPGLFEKFAEFTGKGEDIDPGSYIFNEKLGVEDDFQGIVYDYNALIMAMQYYGEDQDAVKVVFPEGYNCAQIFALLEEKGVCTVAELEEYAANGQLDDYWFLEGIQRGHKYSLEGYLCPDTYDFYTNDEPKRVLEKFLDEFDDRYTERLSQKFTDLNVMLSKKMAANGCSSDYIQAHQLTLHDVVVVASIVEKETASNLESFDFASLFYNRLTDPEDYPYLNSKATMKYAEEYYYKGELNTDAAKESCEFNTDTQPGLISKPICNPGLNSLAAALGPQDTNYHYFVYDQDAGEHHFSATLSEHRNWLKKLGLSDE